MLESMRLLKKRWVLESLIAQLMVSLAYQLARPWIIERRQRIEPGMTGLWERPADQDRYPAVIYLPTRYDAEPQRRWPLLMYLHGSAERGGPTWRLDDWFGPIGSGQPCSVIEKFMIGCLSNNAAVTDRDV